MRIPLPWTFSTFDYRTLCELLDEQNDAEFETAKVDGRAPPATASPSHGPRRGDRAARGRRARVAAGAGDDGYQPPDAPLSRGLEVHPGGSSGELEIWIDRAIVPAGYGWSFPADDEVRVGVGSFDPRFHVKEPTVDLAARLGARRRALPGQLDPAQAARAPSTTTCSSPVTPPATACR